MTRLKIKVTKEVLRQSRFCGKSGNRALDNITENCAVALSVRDIFPEAAVLYNWISPFKYTTELQRIPLPPEVRQYITLFDHCTPKGRLRLPELEFEVEIPDAVIERINIEEIRPLLQNHPTLELVNA